MEELKYLHPRYRRSNREELAVNPTVKEKYLGTDFELRKKNFQLIDEQKRAREKEEDEKYGNERLVK